MQVHNRGILRADNVRVMCLLANASAGLPPLPPGYQTSVQNGTNITTSNWQTLGVVSLNDVRAGFPQIAAFDLTSDKLPPPANLAGNHHFCVLALLHHQEDPYTSAITNTDANSVRERKAAHKNLAVVQFTGTLPAPPPAMVAFRIHGADAEREVTSDLDLDLSDYRGRVRVFLPRLLTSGAIEDAGDGLSPGEDFEQFKLWAAEQNELIITNQGSRHAYHKDWSKQRLRDIQAALDHGLMFVVDRRKKARLRGIVLPPGASHTLFLMIDRPRDGAIGEASGLSVVQNDAELQEILGGLDVRVEIQPDPRAESQVEPPRPPHS